MTEQKNFWVDRIDPNQLKCYVYALVDPIGEKVFYIGRAGGNAAQGNIRPDAHLQEARYYSSTQSTEGLNKPNLKLEKINEIWNRETNNEVKLVILRRGLDLDTSIQLEASYIQYFECFSKGTLTNKYAGFDNDQNGVIKDSTAYQFYAKPLKRFANSTGKNIYIWIFPIKNGLADGLDPVEATLRAWKMRGYKRIIENDENINIAIGVDRNQISRSVIHFKNIEQDMILTNKEKIIGEDISESELGGHFYEKSYRQVLINESERFLGYWLQGNYFVFKFEDENTLRYVRGLRGNPTLTLPN